MADPTVALVADHAGFELKSAPEGILDERGFEAVDLGRDDADAVGHPGMAGKLACAIKDGAAPRGRAVVARAVSDLPSRGRCH